MKEGLIVLFIFASVIIVYKAYQNGEMLISYPHGYLPRAIGHVSSFISYLTTPSMTCDEWWITWLLSLLVNIFIEDK